MGKEGCNYSIELLKTEDIPVVVDLLKTESQAVVSLTPKEVGERAANGLFYVAKNPEGKVIGTQGATVWPDSGLPEIGSAVVIEECRGKGISTALKKTVIGAVRQKFPNRPIIAFTEAASMSRSILQNLHFGVIPMDNVPEEFFTACPPSEEGCFGKTKQNPPACECVVFSLNPYVQIEK